MLSKDMPMNWISPTDIFPITLNSRMASKKL